MHWSVGMLLHAVCVFFYAGEKNRRDEKLENWRGGGVFSRHIFLSAWCCWPGLHSIRVRFWFYVLENVFFYASPACFDVKQMLGYRPFCLGVALPSPCFCPTILLLSPLRPLRCWFIFDKICVLFFLFPLAMFMIRHHHILGLGFCAYYFWNHPLSWITCSSVLLAIALCGLFGKYLTRLLEPLVLLSKLLYCGYTII